MASLLRSGRRSSDDPSTRRPRATYANVTATLALFLVLGGGTAWAAHRYLINSTGQIKPSVLASLRGARGSAGPAGVQGAPGAASTTAGPKGSTGTIGPQGPGALAFVANIAAGSTSAAVGAIPVELQCVAEASVAPDWNLVTTATQDSFVASGTYSGNLTVSSTGDTVPAYTLQDTGTFGSSPGTAFASNDAGGNYYEGVYGSSVLTYSVLIEGASSETVTYGVVTSGTGNAGSCAIDAQVTPSG
jgi:hypothetical protein